MGRRRNRREERPPQMAGRVREPKARRAGRATPGSEPPSPDAAPSRPAGEAPRAAAEKRRFRLSRRRALRVAACLLALGGAAAGVWEAALDSSMFALQRFEVVGAPPALAAQLETTLAPELGRSLLKISAASVDRLVAPLPDVASLRFRRVFPHTLRLEVVPEHPALLLRSGKLAYVVSSRGRVMALERDPAESTLPRFWEHEQLTVGETLTPSEGLLAAAAAAQLRPGLVPGGVRTVTVEGQDVTFVTPDGFEVRLGGVGELALKLAIVQRIAARLGGSISSDAYVDVSVPAWPVVGESNPQVAGIG